MIKNLKMMNGILLILLPLTILSKVYGNKETPNSKELLYKVIINLGGKLIKNSLNWNYEVHISREVDSNIDGIKHVKIKEWFKSPDKRKTEYEVLPEKIDIIYKSQYIICGKEGWIKEGNAPPRRANNIPPQEFQPWKFLIYILDGKMKIDYFNKDPVNNFYILKTTAASYKSYYQIIYFNMKFFPIKRESYWDDNKKEIHFTDFKNINGLWIPIRYKIYNDFINEKEKIEETVEKIEFGPNLKLDESLFTFKK